MCIGAAKMTHSIDDSAFCGILFTILFCLLDDWLLAQHLINIAVLIWFIPKQGQHGSASHDDMVHDVAEAMSWVNKAQDKINPRKKQLVFGRYSSSGHVG